jgi:hypothetical protein
MTIGVVPEGFGLVAVASPWCKKSADSFFRRPKMLVIAILVVAAYIIFNVVDYRRKVLGS